MNLRSGIADSGIIVFRKPAGITSHDAVSIVRRLTGLRRVGHTGTLDPMATGVLPICIGRATRVIEFMDINGSPDAKSYRCEMKLGAVSDTQDIWGTVTQSAPPGDLPDADAICDALKSMEGKGTQTTPLYSAAKYRGKPLYAYARAGTPLPEDARKERDIHINRIVIREIDLANASVRFDIDCSAGVYIRTVCCDVGRKLGCGAVMSALVRTRSCGFRIEESHGPDELESMQGSLPVLPADSALGDLPAVVLDDAAARTFQNGGSISMNSYENVSGPRQGDVNDEAAVAAREGFSRVYADSRFIGIAKCERGVLKPRKVISE
ncbi:MAG: tRNA pseudouridine(55) synthase TruB [Clostridiales Family XIII bacterium]|jgi:tRNA pseudouridine55 synthase|nr:tRNA pseudouridine(55) synthase TruB [Clostridiales Family XIII bacterium]